MLKKICLILATSTLLTSCGAPKVNVRVPNITIYSTNGLLTNGAIWAQTETTQTGTIDSVHYVWFLQASDGSSPENPKHAAAISISADDFGLMLTAEEQLCQDLGKYCTAQEKAAIAAHRKAYELVVKKTMEALERLIEAPLPNASGPSDVQPSGLASPAPTLDEQ